MTISNEKTRIQDHSSESLLAQIRESFGRVVYSHKIHEKQADICFYRHRWMQGALITLTAISSGTFLTNLTGVLGNSRVTSLIVSFIALLMSWITLGMKTFNFAEEANAHRAIATELWDIRESYISLIADLTSANVSCDDARDFRDELQAKAFAVYKAAPRTGDKALKKARKGLKKDEEMTFTSHEINMFLPEQLRVSKSEDTDEDL